LGGIRAASLAEVILDVDDDHLGIMRCFVASGKSLPKPCAQLSLYLLITD